MWWHTRSNSNSNIPQTLYSWSDPELEDWSTSFLKRPEAFPMSPSPDLLVAPSNVSLVAGPYLYGYRSHPAPTPVTFEPISSPALSSVSSTYLDPHTVNGYLNERNQPPTPTVTCATLSSTNDYDPQCPSPWADVTSSPVPSSVYPNQTTIKRPFDENTPSSSSIQENGAALTPTSHYDDRLCGPWFNMTPSSVPIEESHCTSEATNEPSQSKLPCRSRRRAVKKQLVSSYTWSILPLPNTYLNTFAQAKQRLWYLQMRI
jgi:hypothetical protein